MTGQDLQSGLRLPESRQSGPQNIYVKTHVSWPHLPNVGLWTKEELAAKLQKDREILKAELSFGVLTSIAALYVFVVSRRKTYLGLIAVNALFALLGIHNAGLLMDWMHLDATGFVGMSAYLTVACCFALTWLMSRSSQNPNASSLKDTRQELESWLALLVLFMVAFEPSRAVLFVYQFGVVMLLAEAYFQVKSWMVQRLRPIPGEVVRSPKAMRWKEAVPFGLIFGSVFWWLGQTPLAPNALGRNFLLMAWPVLVTFQFLGNGGNKVLRSA